MYLEMIPCEYGSMERKVRKCSDGEISRDENEQGDKGKLSNLTVTLQEVFKCQITDLFFP